MRNNCWERVALQSLADLDGSFTIVREMRAVPLATDELVQLLVVTVAPLSRYC